MKKKKQIIINLYVIRKVVKACSIAEALKKEKNAPVLDVVLAQSENKSLLPAIGFPPSSNVYEQEDED